eukprot:SAG11_NODE_24703_length_369_cov_1.114815_1_plen_63_part_10
MWPCGANAWTNQYWALRGHTVGSLQPDTPFCLGVAKGGAEAMLADCAAAAAQFEIGFHGRANG